MKILFLTQILPYPPDSGPKVKTWNVLRHLCQQGHAVTLLTFLRKEEEPHLAAVKEWVVDLIPIPIKRSRVEDLRAGVKSLAAAGLPFLVTRDDQPAMRDAIRVMARNGGFDAVHADQVTMAQYAALYRRECQKLMPGEEKGCTPRLVFDAHNATWLILERSRLIAPPWLRPWLAAEALKMKQYEGRLAREFDLTLAVSREDRLALLEAAGSQAGSRVAVVPIAVDCSAMQPVHRKPGFQITTLGTLYYPPNADGIRWFAREVFPLVRREVPQATFSIVGKRPPRDFSQLVQANPGAIQVVGYLPDLTPCLENTAGMVVPVRSGGGMRVRILEAFARGVPVVTTTTGAEGIEALPGSDLLVADSAADFARAVTSLLQNPDLQARLAANGRRLAEQKYDWRAVLPLMDQAYAAMMDPPC